ncbi:MAG: histidine triad nucleotide-binding protein [Anaeromyxobacteraceae bacterium]
MSDCLFCKIVAKQIPAKVVHEDDAVLAFEDVQPQAPTHLLVIPKKHIASLNDLGPGDEVTVGQLFTAAAKLAKARGVADGGWRAVVNVGKDAHQTVFHVHLHVLAGRAFGWPPG